MAIINLKPSGLYTFYQNLSEVPPGALLKANNSVINRTGVLEPRRGFGYYGPTFGTSSSRIKQLENYKDRLLRHIDTTLSFDNGSGTFTDFSGTYAETEAGLRIKGVEANSNFYFTTSTGIKKISATSASEFTSNAGYITNSGGPKAIDGKATIDFATSGFLPALNKVAYRIVWGYDDANGFRIIGSPSLRITCLNQSTINNASVRIRFYVPNTVTNTNYFFRIYRSEYSTSDPSDELNLIFEGNPTEAEIAAGFIDYTDSLPESLRPGGLPLYTNKFSGTGILSSNEPPPLAKDIALYKNHLLYANTRLKHQKIINLQTMSGFVSGTSTLVITDGTTTNTYTFRGAAESTRVTTLSFAGSTDNSYFKMNSASNERQYFVWMDKAGDNTPPSNAEVTGLIPIRANISGSVTDADVASVISIAINAIAPADFLASVVGAAVTITNTSNGNCVDTVDGTTIPTGYTILNLVQGDGEDAAAKDILLSSKASPTDAVEETARSIVNIVNAQVGEIVNAYYLSSSEDVPGKIIFERKDFTDLVFYVGTTDTNITSKFSPEIGFQVTNTSASVANPTLITTSAAHGLAVGNKVFIYGATTTPSINGVQTVLTTPLTTTYTINVNVTVSVAAGTTMTAKAFSDAEKRPNRLYYSKQSEIEAVPILQYADIGSRDAEIRRIIPLRENVFILKDDGIFRLSGDNVDTFSISPFDTTSVIVAADSAVALDNQIYFLADEGVTLINETSSEIISRPIEDKLVPFVTSAANFSTASFAIAYETEKSYLLWTVLSSSDTYARVCYRYNTFTQAWTEWKISKTCGIINPADNKLYLGHGEVNTMEQERKNFNRFDYADRDISISFPSGFQQSSTVVKVNGFSNVAVGDVITQTQYLSIYQYNKLLLKLDLDSGLTGGFYAAFALSAGANITNAITLLVAELNVQDPNSFVDTNGNTSYVFTGSTDFPTIQTEWNEIIDRLNESPTTVLNNYAHSTGTVLYEATVSAIDLILQTVTFLNTSNFIVGVSTLYKHIEVDVEYVPQHNGDPISWKQFSQGTFMFELRNFVSFIVGYNSDLSMNFEEVTFYPKVYGTWGNFVYGEEAVWGGAGDRAPLRTYIPIQKQRCRALGCKFKHLNALEHFACYGLSLSVRPYSENAYK